MPGQEELSEILVTPVSTMITQIAESIGKAQAGLDRASALMAKAAASDETLKEIGYQPTFYVIPEMVVELKVALHFEGATGGNAPTKPRLLATPHNAVYQNALRYTGDGASSIKLKVVPVPSTPKETT
jgi:hypothetical protein